MILPLLLATLQATTPAPTSAADRLGRCLASAEDDPAGAEHAATRWRMEGGGREAQVCLATAYANQQRWPAAATAFQDAAHAAEVAHDSAAAGYWAQAGNAWLAGNEPTKARAALDAALAAGSLTDLQLGEARLDRARALVAAGDLKAARLDIDAALITAGDDPLAWLLSATLARRAGDLTRAGKDIGQALQRSPDDASVELEAGNIAAKAGDEPGARSAWTAAIKAQPTSPAAASAQAALAQFGGK